MIKRAAIYAFFDKDGKVDTYVEYFLRDFSENIERLIIVCNGDVDKSGMRILKKYSSEIIIRENKGFDIGAYQAGMEYLGWNKLKEYDELIILNDTIMGPVYPFSEMFSEMNEKKLDFWGITRHYYKAINPYHCVYGCIPEHIQSYFMAFRKSILRDDRFLQYWENLPVMNTYSDAVGKHELYFTRYFAELGFSWDTYVDTEDLKDRNAQPVIMYARELIEKRKCPIFKRRLFFQDYDRLLDESVGQSPLETYRYLKEKTKYDTDMIISNLLRVCNQEDLAKCLHFNYVLSSGECNREDQQFIMKNRKIALIIHIHYMDQLIWNLEYVKHMPANADIYIITNEKSKADKIEQKVANLNYNKIEVRVGANRGRDVASLLVESKDIVNCYDYVCFAHDKKSLQVKPQSQGESFAYHCMENILYNEIYIYNILGLFERYPRMGILSPTGPNHGDYFSTIGNEWGANFHIVKRLADELKIRVRFDPDKDSQFTLGNYFWFRPAALKILFDKDWLYTDFPEEPVGEDNSILHAIERLYSLAAQQEGFYSGHVLSDEYARIELTNIRHELRRYNQTLSKYEIKRGSAALAQYIDALKLENRQIQESTSWKVTRPIRNILNFIRKSKKI